MTLICAMSVGDTFVSVVAVHSLDKHDEMPVTYEMHLRDLPTGETIQLSYGTEENQVLMHFACWIMADCDYREFNEHSINMRDRIEALDKNRKFLP